MNKRLLLLVIISSLMLGVWLLYVVDRGESENVNARLENNINYAVEDIPNDLSCVSELSNSDKDIICATSTGLVCKNEDDEIVPSLASEFKVSDDGIQYEFKIRSDMYWSDGNLINCDDVVDFFRELLNEGKKEDIEPLLNVYGANDYIDDKTIFNGNVAIYTSNDNVIFRLNKKDDNFISELTKPQYRLRKYLVLWSDIEHNYKNIVYSGNYIIKNVNDNSIVLLANENSDLGDKRITFLADYSIEEAMAGYEVGVRDIVLDPPESELNKLLQANKLITNPKTEGTYLVFNNKDISLDARRNIYDEICDAVQEYQGSNSREFELAQGCYFREEKKDLINVQKRIVEVNKESDWSKPKILTIIGDDNRVNRSICKTLKNWFYKKYKINIKYSLFKDDEFKDNRLKNKYDIILVKDKPLMNEETKFYSILYDYFYDENKDIFEKINTGSSSKTYSDLENSLFNTYNIVPLCFHNNNIAISDKISDIRLDGNCNIDFTDIDLN